MRVRAKGKVQVDNVLRQEGDEFEYNGPPNPHLEPLDQPKQREEGKTQGATPKKDDPDDPESAHYPGKKK